MKIAIVGTSNSVMPKGYISGLRASSFVESIENFSLGHSTTVALPYLLERIDMGQFDYCIFDFVVNEEAWTDNVEGRHAIFARLVDMLDRLHATGCVPVPLIMPTRGRVGRMSPVQAMYRKFSERFHLPFMDGFTILERIREHIDLPTERFFRDASHLLEWAATALGLVLAEELHKLLPQVKTRTLRSVQGPRCGYYPAPGLGIKQGTLVQRKTSLVSAEFLRFEGPGAVDLDLGDAQTVVGLGVNMGQTSAKMTLSGAAQSEVFYGTEYFDPAAKRFTFVIRPTEPTACRDGKIKLSWQSSDPKSDVPVVLELHGLSVAKQATRLITFSLNLTPEQIDMARSSSGATLQAAGLVAQRLLA